MATRFVDKASSQYRRFVEAAEEYPSKLSVAERENLFKKPYDEFGGHVYYISGMYQLLNMIRVLNLPRSSIIADVGGGSGWVGEILLCLGYRVVLVEPSSGMVEVAMRRVKSASDKMGCDLSSRLAVLNCTIESLPENNPWAGAIDAALFCESFHHVVDEAAAARNAFHILKQGGALAICGESRWHPGNQDQEDAWRAEMDAFGTLESPFTADYLDEVLSDAGFANVVFYHGVNGLFGPSELGQKLGSVSSAQDRQWQNTVVARKPCSYSHPILSVIEQAACEYTIHSVEPLQGEGVNVDLTVRNVGTATWLPDGPALGHVTLALTGQSQEGAVSLEASSRARLSSVVAPGETARIQHSFRVRGARSLTLRLVAEQAFWFKEGLAIERGDARP